MARTAKNIKDGLDKLLAAHRESDKKALDDDSLTELIEAAHLEFNRALDDRPISLSDLKPFFSGKLYRVVDRVAARGSDGATPKVDIGAPFAADFWNTLETNKEVVKHLIAGREETLRSFEMLTAGFVDQRSERAEIHLFSRNSAGNIVLPELVLNGRPQSYGMGFTYALRGKPRWLRDEQNLRDDLKRAEEVRELVLFTFTYPFLFVHTSGDKSMDAIVEHLRESLLISGSAWQIDDVDTMLLRMALTGDITSSMYLKGMHAPIQIRPSNKNVHGPDVRYTLEPARDSTFDFSYAKCRLRIEEFFKPFDWLAEDNPAAIADKDFLERIIDLYGGHHAKLKIKIPLFSAYTGLLDRSEWIKKDEDERTLVQEWRDDWAPALRAPDPAQGAQASWSSVLLGIPIVKLGVSVLSNTVDERQSHNFIDFARRLDVVRGLLLHTERLFHLAGFDPGRMFGEQVGFDILGRPLNLSRIVAAGEQPQGPYEVDLALGDIDETLTEDDRTALSDWEAHGELRLVADSFHYSPQPEMGTPIIGHDWRLKYDVYWGGQSLAQLDHAVRANSNEPGITSFTNDVRVVSHPRDQQALERVLEIAKAHLVVRFHSGHVLRGGRFYKPAVAETFFKRWHWLSLRQSAPGAGGAVLYDFHREKPKKWDTLDEKNAPLDTSRKRSEARVKLLEDPKDRSLFAMVAHNAEALFNAQGKTWWLLCDDRANEVADFVFVAVDQKQTGGSLTLMHVKGGGKGTGDGAAREVSITNYETVVAQATKNLRHLDPALLARRYRLEAQDGRPGVFMVSKVARQSKPRWTVDTEPFIDQLEWLAKRRGSLRTRVVILQPHQRASIWEAVRAAASGVGNLPEQINRQTRAAFMLSTLLLSAESYCANYGATFEVWGEQDTAQRVSP